METIALAYTVLYGGFERSWSSTGAGRPGHYYGMTRLYHEKTAHFALDDERGSVMSKKTVY